MFELHFHDQHFFQSRFDYIVDIFKLASLFTIPHKTALREIFLDSKLDHFLSFSTSIRTWISLKQHAITYFNSKNSPWCTNNSPELYNMKIFKRFLGNTSVSMCKSLYSFKPKLWKTKYRRWWSSLCRLDKTQVNARKGTSLWQKTTKIVNHEHNNLLHASYVCGSVTWAVDV